MVLEEAIWGILDQWRYPSGLTLPVALTTEFLASEVCVPEWSVAEVALTTWVPHKPIFHNFADISKTFDTVRKNRF